MEKIEEKDVDRGEGAHQPALHDEEEHQIHPQTPRARLQRIEAGGETDDACQHKEWQRNAVESQR